MKLALSRHEFAETVLHRYDHPASHPRSICSVCRITGIRGGILARRPFLGSFRGAPLCDAWPASSAAERLQEKPTYCLLAKCRCGAHSRRRWRAWTEKKLL